MTRFDGLFDKKRKRSPEPDPVEIEQSEPEVTAEPESIAPPLLEPTPKIVVSPPVSPPVPPPIKPEEPLAKSKDPNYQRSTVYLPKAIHQRLKLAAIQDGKEISEVIEGLVKDWLDHRDV